MGAPLPPIDVTAVLTDEWLRPDYVAKLIGRSLDWTRKELYRLVAVGKAERAERQGYRHGRQTFYRRAA